MGGPNEDVARAVLRRHVGRDLRFEYCVPGSPVRADAMAVNLGSLDGWEIKTAVDSKARLASQVDGYQRFFDRCWLFTAPKHAEVELPPWWGLVVFNAEPFAEFDWSTGWTHEGRQEWRQRFDAVADAADVTVVRQAQQSPCQDPIALWCTMWAGERKAVLAALDVQSFRQWHVDEMTSRLSFDQMRALARWTLVNRDPGQYPFSKARAIWWATEVSKLLGLGWGPPAEVRASAQPLGDEHEQPSLFEVLR